MASDVWASDVLAERIVDLGVRQVFFTAGASFLGLFESLCQLPAERRPALVPTLHEEHAIAMAHGSAKVSQRPAVVLLHSNVGLLHALMAIYNAYCDRVPMLILGAAGPFDAAARRPWIDWVHTMGDQAATARAFLKWDDQPASLAAALESLDRAMALTSSAPRAPVLVTLDSAMLMARAPTDGHRRPSAARVSEPGAATPAVEALAASLVAARAPVILMGRVSRDPADWRRRIDLAEMLGAAVLTDMKQGAAFPASHRLHAGVLRLRDQRPTAESVLQAADLVLSLDWVDLAGLEGYWRRDGRNRPQLISVSADEFLHNGATREHQALPTVDWRILATPDQVVAELLPELRRTARGGAAPPDPWWCSPPVDPATMADQGLARVAQALRSAVGSRPVCFVRVPLGWNDDLWHWSGPMDYLGFDGGGGLGSGPGMTIGAALELRGRGVLPVAVIGDGDYLMGVNALWTAAHCRVPLLLVVVDNGGFLNEHLHEVRLAQQRGRVNPLAGLGSVLGPPNSDLAALAEAQGLMTAGCSSGDVSLTECFASAVANVDAGNPTVVTVRIPVSSPADQGMETEEGVGIEGA